MHKSFLLLFLTIARLAVAAQSEEWSADAVNAPQVWRAARGANVNVVVIDSGIDFHHADLQSNYAGGYNTFDPTQPPFDDNRHGTHVAGIIAAADNDQGIIGIAPASRLWAVKIFDAHGVSSGEQVIAALDWVVSQKAALGGNWIVNMSFSDDEISAGMIDATRRAHDAGVLLIAAAGLPNSHLGYPGALPEVIAVGAVDANNRVSDLSATGNGLALVAPGIDVLSTIPTNSVPASTLRIAGELPIRVRMIAGSHQTSIAAPLVDTARPDAIVLMQRGDDVAAQIANATNAGAIGVLLVVPDDGVNTLIAVDRAPLAGVISNTDAAIARNHLGETVTLTIRSDDYARLSGMSQAAPQVSGVAALLWSLKPTATAQEIRDAMTHTARDLGPPGYDVEYGYGLVDAYAAAKFLAPEKFNASRRRAK